MRKDPAKPDVWRCCQTFEQRTEETLGRLTKQRTLLNVRKKKRQPLYAALADAEALEPSRALYEEGLTGMEQEFEQYMKAVKLLEDSGIPQEVLKKEKAEVYEQLSEVNRKIRQSGKSGSSAGKSASRRCNGAGHPENRRTPEGGAGA